MSSPVTHRLDLLHHSPTRMASDSSNILSVCLKHVFISEFEKEKKTKIFVNINGGGWSGRMGA